jgi:hypothetical protein
MRRSACPHREVPVNVIRVVGNGHVDDLERVIAAVDPVAGRPRWRAGAEQAAVLTS